MKIHIHPDTEEEAVKISRWYASHELRLRKQFERELRNSKNAILANPFRFPKLEYYQGAFELRRKILGIFSYVAINVVLNDLITIIAISHTSREPLYWIDRLNTLE